MKVLLLHHVETMWDISLKRFGTSFNKVSENILRHIEDADDYDRVILTRFDMDELEDAHYDSGLAYVINDVYDYSYGWSEEDSESFDIAGVEYVEGGNHSEIVPIYDWIKELKGHTVDLAGAFDGGCIEDMEYALSGAGVNYNRLNHLIV